eukprot:1389408-Lingulodinium_polyedra.AAC.1
MTLPPLATKGGASGWNLGATRAAAENLGGDPGLDTGRAEAGLVEALVRARDVVGLLIGRL